MTFEPGVMAFAERFLSDRTFQLIVAPALADLHFAGGNSRLSRAANRLAVVRAVAGALREDLKGGFGSFAALAVVPAGYYLFLLVLGLDFFKSTTEFLVVAVSILFLSLGPVMVCFWPARRTLPRSD